MKPLSRLTQELTGKNPTKAGQPSMEFSMFGIVVFIYIDYTTEYLQCGCIYTPRNVVIGSYRKYDVYKYDRYSDFMHDTHNSIRYILK